MSGRGSGGPAGIAVTFMWGLRESWEAPNPAMASSSPPAGDDRALHPLLASAVFVAVVVLATATAFAWSAVFAHEGEQPPKAKATADVQHTENQGGWIELLLLDAEVEEIPLREVDLAVTGPGGEQQSLACETPRVLEEGGPCRVPVGEAASWSRGHALWIPCQEEGVHGLTLTVSGGGVLETEVECRSAALG